jgi:glycosyltransferase involved in cell wall biosynthesis
MGAKVKLLFVLPEYPPDYGGGIATFYGALLPALVELGHEVTVVVGSAFVRGGGPDERDGVRVRFLAEALAAAELRRFDRFAAVPELQHHLAAAWAIWREMAQGDFDLVEATDWGFLFVPWVAEPGPRVVVRLHGSCGQIAQRDPAPGEELQGDLERLIEASVIRHADAVATYSRANALEWEGVLGRPVCLQLPPVQGVIPEPTASWGDRGFVAGRLQYWKGPHVVCKALRRLGPDGPTIEWAGRPVIHNGTGRSYDRYLAEEFPDVWGSRLVALGRIPQAEVAQRQRAAAFVIVPSTWDMFNLTAPEAMAQGAILLCSEGAGAVDLIESGVNGFSFPAGNDAALAELIQRVRGLDPAARRAIRSAALATAREKLAPAFIASMAAALYQQVTARPRAQPLDAWSRQVASPGERTDRLGFLDRLPLKALVRYSVSRSISKARQVLSASRHGA